MAASTPTPRPTTTKGAFKNKRLLIGAGITVAVIGAYLWYKSRSSSSSTSSSTTTPAGTAVPSTPTGLPPTQVVSPTSSLQPIQVGGGFLSWQPIDGFEWVQSAAQAWNVRNAGGQLYYLSQLNPPVFMPIQPPGSPLAAENPPEGTPLYVSPNEIPLLGGSTSGGGGSTTIGPPTTTGLGAGSTTGVGSGTGVSGGGGGTTTTTTGAGNTGGGYPGMRLPAGASPQPAAQPKAA